MTRTRPRGGCGCRWRLGGLAAWRWAVGSGLVPPADAGPGVWSRAVVEAADPEAVRAALRGPIGAGVAAERLTAALGEPLRCWPRVTAAVVGHLARAGLLVRLGGDAECRDLHPEQVTALARRRDLSALLDRRVPLGPDQAARRLGVRRVDFDAVALAVCVHTTMLGICTTFPHGITPAPIEDLGVRDAGAASSPPTAAFAGDGAS